jgi:hypothetical protein
VPPFFIEYFGKKPKDRRRRRVIVFGVLLALCGLQWIILGGTCVRVGRSSPAETFHVEHADIWPFQFGARYPGYAIHIRWGFDHGVSGSEIPIFPLFDYVPSALVTITPPPGFGPPTTYLRAGIFAVGIPYWMVIGIFVILIFMNCRRAKTKPDGVS